jgi:hypothetical protein
MCVTDWYGLWPWPDLIYRKRLCGNIKLNDLTSDTSYYEIVSGLHTVSLNNIQWMCFFCDSHIFSVNFVFGIFFKPLSDSMTLNGWSVLDINLPLWKHSSAFPLSANEWGNKRKSFFFLQHRHNVCSGANSCSGSVRKRHLISPLLGGARGPWTGGGPNRGPTEGPVAGGLDLGQGAGLTAQDHVLIWKWGQRNNH